MEALPRPLQPGLYDTKTSASTMSLDAEMANLKEVCKELFPMYKQLCLRYDQERRKMQKEHRLRKFPSMSSWLPSSGPLLTNSDLEMRAMSSDVLRLNRFEKFNQFKQKVIFTCASSDTEKVKSSYIFLRNPGKSCRFGRVEFLFSHTSCENNTVFACVTWFSDLRQDCESSLLSVSIVNIDDTVNPIVPASSLWGPIVTAIDHNRLVAHLQ